MRAIEKLLVIGAVMVSLAGCASDDMNADGSVRGLPTEPGRSVAMDTGQKAQQCVPYAREHSDVKIYGDAWTWWSQAAGKYAEGSNPSSGAVLVLSGYAGPERAHVAVVRKIVSSREIRIDHANWLDDGSIYLNDPVVDVSANNDWTEVRVFNIKTGGWGSKTYPVQGFIGGSGSDAPASTPILPDNMLMAKAEFDPIVGIVQGGN
jgi:surface antigen